MPKISVIVAVYKAEAYIHRCVDSLLAQTFADFEVLLVDDGSPDRSGEICDEYARKDRRVRVFHKENGGVSSARQCGLDNAEGEYTIHADPDDWVEPNMLEELYAKAKEDNADIVLCDYYMYKAKSRYRRQTPRNTLPQTLLKQYLHHRLHGSLCNKLIKRELYSLYDIKFPVDMILREDMFVVCNLMMHPVKVTYLNKAYYHYDYSANNNSLVRTPSLKTYQSTVDFINYFSERWVEQDVKEEFYQMKLNTKRLALAANVLSPDALRKLYSEINERLIREGKNSLKPFYKFCLARFLTGSMSYKHAYHSLRIYLGYRKYEVKFRRRIHNIVHGT